MKNIQLTLNVDTIELIIAGGIVIIALVVVFGFFAWISKTNKQNRTLEKIDDKLRESKSRVEVEFVNEMKQKDEEDTAEEKINEDDSKDTMEKPAEENAETDTENGAETETDVLEEIQKMIIEESKKKAYVSENFRNNIGKSGKHYSREEVESIIKD